MTQARSIQLTEFGGPEVMRLVDTALPPPGPGEAQLRQTAIGFNYIDIYQRAGKYPLPTPTGLGHEAAGVIEAVAEGVTDLRVGDHVVYMNAGVGAYADRRNVPAAKLVKIPAGISDEDAAAVFFKAMTAQYLVKKTYAVQPGDIVLVHAAAGGVGQILSGWAHALGACAGRHRHRHGRLRRQMRRGPRGRLRCRHRLLAGRLGPAGDRGHRRQEGARRL